ncbi:MAG TPA: hypothetical protein VNU49_09840 [Opitutaceae bacterium]|jgi:hypothetical protein|nr:hypothetical protein [Opitutaceae bacterium]
MTTPSFFDLVSARDPRRIVRFPEAPLDQALAEWEKIQSTPAPAPPAAAPAPALDQIAAIATHVWRAKNKLIDPESGQPREETKRTYRHIESTLDALAQMGVVIRDQLNEPYDPGLPVNVLTFQPMSGLSRDTIVEVLRPTIIWRERVLQVGEVIVGTPESSSVPS